MNIFLSKISRIARISHQVGAPPSSLFKLLWFGCIKPSLLHRGMIKQQINNKFSIRARLGKSESIALTLSDNGLDVCTFLEIFGSDHLNPLAHGGNYPQVVYDIGANVGISTAYFSLMFPNSKIYAFEPEPGNYLTASRNLEALPNVLISKRAISEHVGTMAFECGADTRGGKLVEHDGATSISTQAVDVTTIESLIDQEGLPSPHFLKIDVEGAEVDVLRGAGHHLKCAKLLNIETHSKELHNACLELVKDAGFRILSDKLPPHGMGEIWATREI